MFQHVVHACVSLTCSLIGKGGAIRAQRGKVAIENCTFERNSASYLGGSVFGDRDSSITLTGTRNIQSSVVVAVVVSFLRTDSGRNHLDSVSTFIPLHCTASAFCVFCRYDYGQLCALEDGTGRRPSFPGETQDRQCRVRHQGKGSGQHNTDTSSLCHTRHPCTKPYILSVSMLAGISACKIVKGQCELDSSCAVHTRAPSVRGSRCARLDSRRCRDACAAPRGRSLVGERPLALPALPRRIQRPHRPRLRLRREQRRVATLLPFRQRKIYLLTSRFGLSGNLERPGSILPKELLSFRMSNSFAEIGICSIGSTGVMSCLCWFFTLAEPRVRSFPNTRIARFQKTFLHCAFFTVSVLV